MPFVHAVSEASPSVSDISTRSQAKSNRCGGSPSPTAFPGERTGSVTGESNQRMHQLKNKPGKEKGKKTVGWSRRTKGYRAASAKSSCPGRKQERQEERVRRPRDSSGPSNLSLLQVNELPRAGEGTMLFPRLLSTPTVAAQPTQLVWLLGFHEKKKASKK